MRTIHKFGLAVISGNRLLLCKPFAFADLIVPGGIREGDEDHVANLLRETREELGPRAQLLVPSLQHLGTFEDVAAGRTDTTVLIDLYKGDVDGDLVASSEIAALVWYDPRTPPDLLSPVVRNKILPFLLSEGLLTV